MTKQEAKREKIISTAIEVFSKEGFHGSKITKIAELSGIATGSIYLYFKNKEQILEEIFLRVWTDISERFKDLIADNKLNGTEKVTEFVLFLAERVRKNNNIAPIILQEYQFWNASTNSVLKEKIDASLVSISDVLAAGIARGEFRTTLDPKLVTAFLSGGVWFILEYWTDHFDTVTYSSIEKQLRDLAARCLK